MRNKKSQGDLVRVVNYNHNFGELVLFGSNKYQPIHRWYSLVEGFSSELVRRIIGEQNTLPQACLDPFGGVGTTALVCQDLGIKCFSLENNPFLFNLARTKLRSDYDPDVFKYLIDKLEAEMKNVKKKPILPVMDTETLFESKDKDRWIFHNSVAYGIFDVVEWINGLDSDKANYKGLFECALSSILVSVSNVFRNGKCLSYKSNWKETKLLRRDIHDRVLDVCRNIMLVDLRTRKYNVPTIHNFINCFQGDARILINELKNDSIDIVITSPPYLNSRDYADIYRLELWILGHISTFEEERKLRKSAIRSHVQTTWESCDYPKIMELEYFIKHITEANGHLWNKNIPNMIKGYFADMEAILHDLRSKLRKGSRLYINVANSAYGNKVCEVDVIIAKIARQQGYTPIEIREVRHVKSSRQQKEINKLRESIVVIEK